MRQPQAHERASVGGHVLHDREHDRRERAGRRGRPSAATSRRARACPSGACSTDISTAPPHSPPTPMPCAKRSDDEQDRREDADRRVRRQAADQERRDAHDHQRQHEHRLAPDAVAEVTEDDAAQRPGGEADGIGARTRPACRSAGSAFGKNSSPKTSAAAVPYRKKSYHSIVVPMKLARATFLTSRTSPACWPPATSCGIHLASLKAGSRAACCTPCPLPLAPRPFPGCRRANRRRPAGGRRANPPGIL